MCNLEAFWCSFVTVQVNIGSSYNSLCPRPLLCAMLQCFLKTGEGQLLCWISHSSSVVDFWDTDLMICVGVFQLRVFYESVIASFFYTIPYLCSFKALRMSIFVEREHVHVCLHVHWYTNLDKLVCASVYICFLPFAYIKWKWNFERTMQPNSLRKQSS